MFVQQQLDLANQLGLESQMQKVTWLLLALHTGGEFSRTNEGRALLATLPQQASNFEINIEKLSEAVWQSGRPFWES